MPCIGSSSSYTNNACGPLPITLPSNLSPEASSVNALINDLFQVLYVLLSFERIMLTVIVGCDD